MGERLELGPLELKVLGVLWERGRASAVRHVQPSFPQLAYTTVMTTLDRLYRKGMLRLAACALLVPLLGMPLYAPSRGLIEVLVAFGR